MFCTKVQLEARKTYYISPGTAILAVSYRLEARATHNSWQMGIALDLRQGTLAPSSQAAASDG